MSFRSLGEGGLALGALISVKMKVIKIGAVWCSTCLVMRPRWQKVEEELPWLKTEYLDFDEQEVKLEKMGIKAEEIPVFIFYDQSGQELTRLKGEISEKQLVELCQKYRGK